MIARLLGAAIHSVVYVCAATLIAQAIILAYLWASWGMDRGRLVQMLAIAQGVDLFEISQQQNPAEDEPGAEQPSLEQIIEARLTQDRDLKMREMALQSGLEQLKSDQGRITERRDANRRVIDAFRAELAALQDGAQAKGRVVVGRTLESLEPEQAKKLILEMLDKDELEEVVMLMSKMPERPRANILAEFKTDKETEAIAEVLRRIRQGYPQAAIADKARTKLNGNSAL